MLVLIWAGKIYKATLLTAGIIIISTPVSAIV